MSLSAWQAMSHATVSPLTGTPCRHRAGVRKRSWPAARTQLGYLGDRHIALVPGVLRDPASRFVERVPHHIHAERLVTGLPKVAEAHPDVYQGATATGDDALLDGRARGGNGVFEPV